MPQTSTICYLHCGNRIRNIVMFWRIVFEFVGCPSFGLEKLWRHVAQNVCNTRWCFMAKLNTNIPGFKKVGSTYVYIKSYIYMLIKNAFKKNTQTNWAKRRTAVRDCGARRGRAEAQPCGAEGPRQKRGEVLARKNNLVFSFSTKPYTTVLPARLLVRKNKWSVESKTQTYHWRVRAGRRTAGRDGTGLGRAKRHAGGSERQTNNRPSCPPGIEHNCPGHFPGKRKKKSYVNRWNHRTPSWRQVEDRLLPRRWPLFVPGCWRVDNHLLVSITLF